MGPRFYDWVFLLNYFGIFSFDIFTCGFTFRQFCKKNFFSVYFFIFLFDLIFLGFNLSFFTIICFYAKGKQIDHVLSYSKNTAFFLRR